MQQRLRGFVPGVPPEELCDELLTRMVPADPDDDVTVIAVRLHSATRTD